MMSNQAFPLCERYPDRIKSILMIQTADADGVYTQKQFAWRKNMEEQKEFQIERLDSELEQTCIDAEYEELLDYFVAIERGLEVQDPRPRMSFITPAMETKAKEQASCVVDIIEEFDGEIEEGGQL